MHVKVYKFGGASLSDTDKVKFVATFLKKEKEEHGLPVLAVVSAMGKTTDDLIHLARQVSTYPQRRELDMLLTTGERVAMSLISLALNEIGMPAISFTGSQAGILTDTSHGNARILEVKPFRLEEQLREGKTVVLAGFQGVSPITKEITTLGRGGTDTTAVAMASHFHSDECVFKKDVGGVFSADPKVVPEARHLPLLTYKNLIDMTFWGAKFLHYRAAELAYSLKVPLRFSHFQNENEYTLVSGDHSMMEQQKILAVNNHKQIFELCFAGLNQQKTLSLIHDTAAAQNIAMPQILSIQNEGSQTRIYLLGDIGERAESLKLPCTQRAFSTVTLTCQGAVNTELLYKANELSKNFMIQAMFQDTTNLTYVVPQDQREEFVKTMHSLIVEAH